MTDQEMTLLCAQAMGAGTELSHGAVGVYERNGDGSLTLHIYDPLHDDEQAMALVKQLHLDVLWDTTNAMNAWRVCAPTDSPSSWSADLNHAIVECVAKLTSGETNG